MKINPEPPKTLSAALRLALTDFKIILSRPDLYIVDMADWHRQDLYGVKCRVCLAGAVLACTFEPGIITVNINAYGDEWRDTFFAINELRSGYVEEAVQEFNVEGYEANTEDREVASYESDPEQFIRDMEQLLADLEANETTA